MNAEKRWRMTALWLVLSALLFAFPGFAEEAAEPLPLIQDDANLLTESEELALYDEMLRQQYGDYMTPPPESERKPLHEDWRSM